MAEAGAFVGECLVLGCDLPGVFHRARWPTDQDLEGSRPS
jgi:hypothetical protein